MGLVLVVSAAVLVTSILSGIFGMAGGLILMGVYTVLFPVSVAMVLHGTTQVSANGFRFLLLRSEVHWRGVAYYAAGSAVAAAIFFALAIVPGKNTLLLLLGLLPFVAVVPRMPKLDFARPAHAIVCGIAMTAVQLMAGVAGPILDVFFTRAPLGRREVVATKAVTQVFGHAVKLVYFVPRLRGELSSREWGILVAASVVFALLGTIVGGRILDRLSDRHFRAWSQAIILVVGGVYLVRGLSAIFSNLSG